MDKNIFLLLMKITNPQIEEALQVLRKTNNHTYKSFSETAEHQRERKTC